MNQSLPHVLDRTILIQASPDTVFRFFTDDARWASWWGTGSTIDPRPGGRVYIRHPNGVETEGEVLDVAPPERIVFTYGFTSGRPIPPGTSRVTIRLDHEAAGTRLRLTHEFADPAVRDEHVQGWRYQLSVFANAVTDFLHADAAGVVDAWFLAWQERDEATRLRALGAIVTPDIRMSDRFSLVEGVEDLSPHIAATHRFMPGLRIERTGDARHCQGTLLVDWVARAGDGAERGRGTSVFSLHPDGRIRTVTGFWQPPASS